jgi:hypothetical protein
MRGQKFRFDFKGGIDAGVVLILVLFPLLGLFLPDVVVQAGPVLLLGRPELRFLVLLDG